MSDPVDRLNAALEGRYTIERKLGEGGMATVYLADDLKHNRKVALKVLKPELAAVVGSERFGAPPGRPETESRYVIVQNWSTIATGAVEIRLARYACGHHISRASIRRRKSIGRSPPLPVRGGEEVGWSTGL